MTTWWTPALSKEDTKYGSKGQHVTEYRYKYGHKHKADTQLKPGQLEAYYVHYLINNNKDMFVTLL